MLGFGAVSSSAVSGIALKIVAVPVAASVVIGLSFPLSVTAGQNFAATATLSLQFGLSANALLRQAAAVEMPFSFATSGHLRAYGNPIAVNAAPLNYATIGQSERFVLTAIGDNFTARAVK